MNNNNKKKHNKITTIKFIDGKPLDPNSSLNDYFMCVCGRKYDKKTFLIKHIQNCKIKNIVCRVCNLEFASKGNLVNHAYYMHGDKDMKKQKKETKDQYKCGGCDFTNAERWKLKYHIRRQHFNLLTKISQADDMRINQVWFERVLNSNFIVQIKKTGVNSLTMKRIPPNANVKIHECSKIIDLRNSYPIGTKQVDELCVICLKMVNKKYLRQHMNETHFNYKKHKCNNCNKSFKRSYLYLQHVCYSDKRDRKRDRIRNVIKQSFHSKIRISSVASLKPVVVD